MTNGDNSKGLPLWHGRLNVSSADVLKNLNSSIGFDIRLYKEDIIASKAHAKMLKTVGVYTESELGAVLQGLEKVEEEIESGSIKACLNKDFPLSEINEAHEFMENSMHMGKIVVTIP